MNDSIKSLLALQERDLDLDRLRAELGTIPAKISALKDQIKNEKTALEGAKKELTQLQLDRKQKELDLDAQETSVRKHSAELNAVKSNDAYKALLGEIDKAKSDKSALEDQVLQLMDQIDQATRNWKQKESISKNGEADLLHQIGEWEAKQKALEEQIAGKESERAQTLAALPANLGQQYERIRTNKHGAAVVVLRKEQCAGCHMKVSQNLINEVRRGQKLMTCEHCSRIVYLDEVAAA